MTEVILNGETYNVPEDLTGSDGYGYASVRAGGTLPLLIEMMVNAIADAGRARVGTSATSKNAALSGSQSWVLATDTSFPVGSFFTAGSRGTTTVRYLVRVTGYVSATKTLTGVVMISSGSGGPYTDWDIGPSGPQGDAGPVREHNRIINGTFAVQQRAVLSASDNAFTLDGWKLLLEAANAAVITQDTADVPSRAKYAAKLTVGSGNNNKFGIFQPVEGKRMWDLRGQAVSVRIPLKATAGITDVRAAVVEFTGTEDTSLGDPISTWGSAGTNPTLAANWAYCNTPANLSVTTSWADYLLENVSVGASAKNIGLLIWSDDKTTTQTTDILRVGGYVGLFPGTEAPDVTLPDYADELRLCQRYLFAATGNSQILGNGQAYSTTQAIVILPLPVPMMKPPSLSISSAGHFGLLKAAGSFETVTALSLVSARPSAAKLDATVAANLVAGNGTFLETTNASAELLLSAELT